MEEQKLIERSLMGEKEFKDYLKDNRTDPVKDLDSWVIHLRIFNAVGSVKSIRRAIRRGHVSLDGILYPRRPFNNRANTCSRKNSHSRSFNQKRREIYGQIKSKSLA